MSDDLSTPQADALLLLHDTQGQRHAGSGHSINTFLSLERMGLAHTDGAYWFATEQGMVRQSEERRRRGLG